MPWDREKQIKNRIRRITQELERSTPEERANAESAILSLKKKTLGLSPEESKRLEYLQRIRLLDMELFNPEEFGDSWMMHFPEKYARDQLAISEFRNIKEGANAMKKMTMASLLEATKGEMRDMSHREPRAISDPKVVAAFDALMNLPDDVIYAVLDPSFERKHGIIAINAFKDYRQLLDQRKENPAPLSREKEDAMSWHKPNRFEPNPQDRRRREERLARRRQSKEKLDHKIRGW